jgi:hypothetical protein
MVVQHARRCTRWGLGEWPNSHRDAQERERAVAALPTSSALGRLSTHSPKFRLDPLNGRIAPTMVFPETLEVYRNRPFLTMCSGPAHGARSARNSALECGKRDQIRARIAAIVLRLAKLVRR